MLERIVEVVIALRLFVAGALFVIGGLYVIFDLHDLRGFIPIAMGAAVTWAAISFTQINDA